MTTPLHSFVKLYILWTIVLRQSSLTGICVVGGDADEDQADGNVEANWFCAVEGEIKQEISLAAYPLASASLPPF